MTGTLFIVATPIGNLGDITLRAIETLKSVDLVLAEDTRVTKKLLNHYHIDKRTLSYHQHSSEEVRLRILSELLNGKDIALVTDAGTPGISDPGNELIDYLLENGTDINIVPIPGPSAVATALSVSGFRADKFIFLGFLPKTKRNILFKWLKDQRMLAPRSLGGVGTFAFYESPHRLKKSLEALSEYFESGTRVLVARELTKLHESLYRGTIEEVIDQFPETIKGEVVVVVEST